MAGRDTFSISEAMDTDNHDPESETLFQHTRKNLLKEFSKENNSMKAAECGKHMKVYLRIRPFSEEELAHSENQVTCG